MTDNIQSGDSGARPRWSKPLFTAVLMVTGLFVLYLLGTHFVKCYSDPTGWISMAENLYLRGWVPRWSVTFAGYLYWPLKLLGPHYVYLSNLPWLTLLVLLLSGATYRCLRKDNAEDHLRAQRIFLWLMLVTIWINRDLARELLNPYREAFTFSFLAASLYVLVGPKQRPVYWRTFCSGALLGFSTAVREPHLLAISSVGLMLFYMLYDRMPVNGWRHFPVLVAGMIVGMSSFFVQNAAYSGYWWVPSYMWAKLGPLIQGQKLLHPVSIVHPVIVLIAAPLAGLISAGLLRRRRNAAVLAVEARRRRWKIILLVIGGVFIAAFTFLMLMDWVPAMRTERFMKTGRGTFNHLRGKWDLAGQILLVIGFVELFLKRERLLALMTLPSAIIFLGFWCLYTYVKDRYVFGVEFFVYPIMALGAHRIAYTCSLAWKGPLRRERIQNALVLAAAIGLCGWMVQKAVTKSYSMKVWHLVENKKALEPLLQKPYVFDCERAHYGQALATMMAGTFINVHQHNRSLLFYDMDAVKQGKLDESYTQLSERIFSAVENRNIYDYGVNRRYLVRFWLDSVPVINVKNLPYPVNVYGRILDEPLYHLQKWKNTAYMYRIPSGMDKQKPVLLAYDFLRLWDYPQRSYFRVSAGDQVINIPGTNHFQWMEFPRGVSSESITFESDAGLPADPFIHAFGLNDEITISLGLNPLYWYRNYLSPDFLTPRLIHGGAAILLSEGAIEVPSFADADREVFARFHYSYYVGEIPVNDKHKLVASCGNASVESRIPGKNESTSLFVPLGSGVGGLAMKQIHFHRQMPDFKKQKAKKSMNPERLGFVKLHNVKLWSLPNYMADTLFVSADPEFEPWRSQGFYGTEKGPHGSFCWMQPQAVLVLPPATTPGKVSGKVVLLNQRPENIPATPAWRWNNADVSPTRIEIKGDGNVAEYYFDSMPCQVDAPNILGITSEEWVPSRDSGIRDSRSLGLSFLSAEFKRL